jgi:hypothetical protein
MYVCMFTILSTATQSTRLGPRRNLLLSVS